MVVFARKEVKNAHNEYNRAKAQGELIAAAQKNSKLIQLAIAHESISKVDNPIYIELLSYLRQWDGKALFLWLQLSDRVLKDTEAHCPGMRIKAIHDDITLIGPPD